MSFFPFIFFQSFVLFLFEIDVGIYTLKRCFDNLISSSAISIIIFFREINLKNDEEEKSQYLHLPFAIDKTKDVLFERKSHIHSISKVSEKY